MGVLGGLLSATAYAYAQSSRQIQGSDIQGLGITSTGSTTARSLADRFATVVNVKDFGAVGNSVTDDTAALQNAINAAASSSKALYIPNGKYAYTPPLTINGNLTIIGESLTSNWAGGVSSINVPTGSPPLLGAVLFPVANGQNAVSISGDSLQVNISNLGILFQTTFGQSSTTTGDGINYVAPANTQGLSGARWDNVIVYGHDGNHYAYNLQNPIIGTIIFAQSYGGGGFKLSGNSASLQYGNLTFIEPYSQVVCGGSADGFNLAAAQSSALNLCAFIRPQAIINNAPGITPVSNPPTSSQQPWNQAANATAIRAIAPDLETNVANVKITLGAAVSYNSMDWEGLFTDVTTINAPFWGVNGLLYGPNTRTFNDTTSSGATGAIAEAAFPGWHLTASNPTTYSILSTLCVGAPIGGTNVSANRTSAIYAIGEIYTSGDLASATGVFTDGTVVAYDGTIPPPGGTTGTGIKLSSTSNFGVFFGSGVPTLSAAQGSLYLRTDGSTTATRMYINTNGSTGWTNVVTAA